MRTSNKINIAILAVQTVLLAVILIHAHLHECCDSRYNSVFIDATEFTVEPVEIPEPSSVALFSLGLMVLLIKAGK